MDSLDSLSIQEEIYYWKARVNTMRERLKLRHEEVSFEGIREMKLYHGLKLISSTSLIGEFLDICYCNEFQEYLVLDTGFTIHRFSMQGKPIQPPFVLSSTMAFTKIIWCQEIKIFAGFVPHDDLVWLLETNCKLIQVLRNDFRIENIFYTSYTNEIIAIGPTKATRYPMDQRDQTLNSWKTVNMSDSSFGPTWKLEYSSLIQDNPLSLRLAGSYLTTVYVIPLDCDKEEDSNIPVKFLARRANASQYVITALCFHSTSQWIVGGDQRGSILAWNLKLEYMMNCPEGHRGTVKMIIGHPSICGFISCADDDIVQVWSCNFRDKIESFNELGEVFCMALNESTSSVATLGTKLSCFQMHQLYTFYSPLTSEAEKLSAAVSPISVTRIVVCSSDNVASILSSASGKQLSLLIFPSNCTLVSITYSAITGCLYAAKNDQILVASVRLRPMTLENEWTTGGKSVTSIVAYDHYEEIRGFDLQPQKPPVITPICTRIIVGTEDGELISYENKSGTQESVISAHRGVITKLYCSTLSCQLLSTGADMSVKIWRVLPDIEIPLALLHCLHYTIPITHIACLGFTVCIVSSTELSQMHQLFMYDTVEKRQLEHHPSKNHTKEVLTITTSESLQICATASRDSTIRIWDHQNDIVKILDINVCTKHIAFSSLRGDIVFSAGKHLYRIPHENYLPPKYRLQIVSRRIQDEKEEDPAPNAINFDAVNEEMENVLHPVSSVPLGSLDPDTDVPRLELMLQEQMCMQVKYRDEDIVGIKENILRAKKVTKRKALMDFESWEKHVNELLAISSKVDKEITPSHNVDYHIKKYKQYRKIPNKPEHFRILYGYSLEKFSEYPKLPLKVDNPRLNLDGFIPNSLIVSLSTKQKTSYKKIDAVPKPSSKKQIKYIYPLHVRDISQTVEDIELLAQ